MCKVKITSMSDTIMFMYQAFFSAVTGWKHNCETPLSSVVCVYKHQSIIHLSVRFSVSKLHEPHLGGSSCYWKRPNHMINRYMVTETLLWKVQEIFPCRVSERDQAWLMLWSFLMFHRGEPVLRSKPHPDLPPLPLVAFTRPLRLAC